MNKVSELHFELLKEIHKLEEKVNAADNLIYFIYHNMDYYNENGLDIKNFIVDYLEREF